MKNVIALDMVVIVETQKSVFIGQVVEKNDLSFTLKQANVYINIPYSTIFTLKPKEK